MPSLEFSLFTSLHINIFGYSLVFGPSLNGFIGSYDNFLLINVGYFNCNEHAPSIKSYLPFRITHRDIPSAAFALFMMMFAAITPLLMTGSYAERVRWKSFLAITVLWEILVYYPVAHWMWGGGWLDKMGALGNLTSFS